MADVKYTVEELQKLNDLTNWEKLLAMRDDDIVCDDEAPDAGELLKNNHAKVIGRGPISEAPDSLNKIAQ